MDLCALFNLKTLEFNCFYISRTLCDDALWDGMAMHLTLKNTCFKCKRKWPKMLHATYPQCTATISCMACHQFKTVNGWLDHIAFLYDLPHNSHLHVWSTFLTFNLFLLYKVMRPISPLFKRMFDRININKGLWLRKDIFKRVSLESDHCSIVFIKIIFHRRKRDWV